MGLKIKKIAESRRGGGGSEHPKKTPVSAPVYYTNDVIIIAILRYVGLGKGGNNSLVVAKVGKLE